MHTDIYLVHTVSMTKATQFEASRYTATQFDSAAQKAKFANHFVRFVESDFKATLFPKWFYTRLSMTFGHIAHFSREGFYSVWFTSTRCKVDFLQHPRQISWCGKGDPAFTYADVEQDLMQWIRESGMVEKYEQALASEVESVERAQLASLKAKYEVAQ